MLTIRRAEDRGHADHGWLNAYHTFSFANYYDEAHMSFRALRVINDDRVKPGAGFGTHPHRDMEIVTYVLQGSLEHRDSMGTGSIILPGDVQRMSAGTGVTHSEFNASKTEELHLLQIWLQPSQRDIPPSYEQKTFPRPSKDGQLCLVASADGRDGSLTIHTDVDLYAGLFDHGQTATLPIRHGRHVWLQVARGRIHANGQELKAGDGAALSDETSAQISGLEKGEVLVFDLA